MQTLAVAVIVSMAAAYVAWKLTPGAWRARLVDALGRLALSRGVARARVERWSRAAAASPCGACDSCGACGESPASSSTVGGVTIRRVS